MRFDGSSCMTVPIWDEARMQGGSGLTVMAWMKPDIYTCTEQYDLNAVVGRGWDYSIGSWCYVPTPPPYAQGLAAAVRPANAQTWGYGGGWMLTSTSGTTSFLTWDRVRQVTWLPRRQGALRIFHDGRGSQRLRPDVRGRLHDLVVLVGLRSHPQFPRRRRRGDALPAGSDGRRTSTSSTPHAEVSVRAPRGLP